MAFAVECTRPPRFNVLSLQYEQSSPTSTTRYDQLREQNRARQFNAPAASGGESSPLSRHDQPPLSQSARYDQPPASSSGRFLYDQGTSYISGTPTSVGAPGGIGGGGAYDERAPSGAPPKSGGSGTSYGDEGFS